MTEFCSARGQSAALSDHDGTRVAVMRWAPGAGRAGTSPRAGPCPPPPGPEGPCLSGRRNSLSDCNRDEVLNLTARDPWWGLAGPRAVAGRRRAKIRRRRLLAVSTGGHRHHQKKTTFKSRGHHRHQHWSVGRGQHVTLFICYIPVLYLWLNSYEGKKVLVVSFHMAFSII